MKLTTRLSLLTLIAAISLSASTGLAASHRTHYDKFFFYDKWPRANNGTVYIDYHYSANGNYDYSDEIKDASDSWENIDYSPFVISKTSKKSRANLIVTSDDFGDTGWLGKAYYNRDPKEIRLNEWYHANSPVDGHRFRYSCYENTMLHEFGHTHGLDHYDCPDEVMNTFHTHVFTPNDGDVQGIKDIY